MVMQTLEPGVQLGRYEIVSHIASGGMGAVYKATDTQLRRTVALKVLRSNRLLSERELERFNREARHSAHLTHPNIVTTYDYGYDETHGVYFMTMEFIEGDDLAHHIARKGILSPKQTRNILIQTAEALAHAFDQGVVHRDIKPSNFMLARVRGKVLVKLADFGLALGSDDDEYKVTREGSTVGTIDYMAPEQARDSRAADIRSDIYSLGCTAYHMLTGQPPFAEGGIGERVHKHMNVPPTDVREFNPAVSVGLWEIVRTMLAKNPADRYATPSDLLADLKKVVAEASAADVSTPTLQPIQEGIGRVVTGVVASTPTKAATTASPAATSQTIVVYDQTTSEIEIQRPTPKRSRSRTKKRRTAVWPFVAIGAGLCAIAIVGLVSFEAWRRSLQNPVDPDRHVAKAPDKDTTPVAPTPQSPNPIAPGTTIPVRDPAKSNVEALPVLDLKRLEWPGRALVPFDAVGPRGRLDETKTVHVKGTIALASSPKVLNVALTWDTLGRLKCQESSAFGAGLTYLLVGDHGWFSTGTTNRAVTGDLLSYFQAFHHATILSNLVTLNDGGFEIERGENAQVRGMDTFSIIVRRAQRPTVRMFFERKSSLPCKADYQVRLVDKDLTLEQNVTQVELYFGNYQAIDGVIHWRRLEQWRNGQRFSELNLHAVQFLKSAEDAYFSTPGLDEAARHALVDYRKDVVKNALTRIGPQAGSEFSRLVGGLSHTDAAVRWTACNALRAYVKLWRKAQAAPMQASDVNALSTLALSIDDEMPLFAIEAVTKLGPQAAGAAPHLVSLFQSSTDPKMQVRTLGALKSTAVRTDQTLTLYGTLIDHPDDSIKELAALALLQLGPERLTADQLAGLMGWANRQISAEAERNLRQRLSSVTAKDMPALKQGLRSTVREVQLAYLEALGALQSAGGDAAPDLVPLINSSDKTVAEAAVRVLDRIAKLTEFAREHPDPAVVSASLAALRSKGARDAYALAIYEKQLDHNNDRVKDTAALAMVEFAPERLSNDRLVEFLSRPAPLDLAATFALHKADPAHPELRTKGLPILAMSMKADLSDLKAFYAHPLKNKNAAVLLNIGGASAVANVVKHLLEDNNPKTQVQNQKMEATAVRYLGYELLRELAKAAQTKQDQALIAALKQHEYNLRTYWATNELSLTKNLNQPQDLFQLRTATAESARQAGVHINSLHGP